MKPENSFGNRIRSQYTLHKINDPATQLPFFLIILAGFTTVSVTTLFLGPGKFFSINYFPVFISCFTTLLICIYIDWIEKNKKAVLSTSGWISLLGVFLFESLTWSIAAFSKPLSAAVFTAFPILLCAFHGHLFQSGLKYPYPLMVSTLAASVAFTLNHDTNHLMIFSISAPVALGMNFFLGTRSRRIHTIKKQQNKFREVIDKQIINVHSETIDQVIKILQDLREHNHDAVNEYTGLTLLLPGFIKIAQSEKFDKENIRKATTIAKCIQQCLQSLQQIMKNRYSIEIRNQLQSILVYPTETLENLISEFEQKFPSIHFLKNIPEPVKNISIPFFGGYSALKQVYYNIILHACSENKRSANCIIIETNLDSEGFLDISVSDNGHAFSPIQLETPLYHSDNTLYASLRILKSNGGSLIRKNRNNINGAFIVTKLRIQQNCAVY